MNARRLILTIATVFSAWAVALIAGVAPAGAVTHFGGFGSGAGDMHEAWGIAFDHESGDLYVGDVGNRRIDVFDAAGNFVMAWGWGVLDGAAELQVCTSSCQAGLEGKGVGQLSDSPMAVAVDNDPVSSSYGDVYIEDSSNHRVEKFGPSGEYLLTFGEEGAGNGQFESIEGDDVIAVGPAGRVYVGDRARVDVFEASGAWREDISLASLSTSGKVSSLAVDASGDLFVKYGGVPGVREFEPNGTEEATRFDVGSESVRALALDESGDLFVADASAGFDMLEYSPAGASIASFGANAVNFTVGMTFDPEPGAGALYAISLSLEPEGAEIVKLPVPVPGAPVIEPGSVFAEGGRDGHATVRATLDAEDNQTSYRVEYVSEADFQASGYANASSTPEMALGSASAEVPVSVELSELVPGGVYHYRIVASNVDGSQTSADQTVQAVPPALVNGPWVTSVTSTSATFAAEIDPLGSSTEYRIEYGPSSSYGETLSGNAGEGEGFLPLAFHRQDLAPGTVYHYRVVVANSVGVYAGADHTFTTQATSGQELSLPDGRAWELVSPADKKGALIGVWPAEEPFQAAVDGSAIAYPVSEPVGEGAVGRNQSAMILSKRGMDGWSSRDVSPPNSLPPAGEGPARGANRGGTTLRVFSADLSLGLYEPETELHGALPLSAEATERTLYLHDEASDSYLPLETQADVMPGIEFRDDSMEFLAGTPDLSHVIFGTSVALTPEAVGFPIPPEGDEGQYPEHHNLYEWYKGGLQLVNITPASPGSPDGTTGPDAWLGSSTEHGGMTANAISRDGRWVAWSDGRLEESRTRVDLYVRDMVAQRTFRLGGEYPRFETMSSDGSKVFFVETEAGRGGDLYVFDTTTGTQTDLTPNHGSEESNAGVQNAVMGASEDGSYVYFVATGVLASGAVKGADNVYVLHDADGAWTTRYIATLAGEDAKSWRGKGGNEPASVEGGGVVYPETVSSRVSPDGRYLAFMSERSLTGYDNLDALSGQPDEEVYLYDAASSRLVCASCNPTGARPVGVLDEASLFADMSNAWSLQNGTGNHWLAGSIPGWARATFSLPAHQPRYLSDSGRLFFDSPDALVSQDTNGLEDVYQYEPDGIGSCTNESTTYGTTSGGCVDLISSGQSAGESIFVDASESGDDVFFATNSKLTSEDYDTAYDMYDAHVCTSEAPCRGESVSPPSCTSGDSCKAAPSPQPETFGPAPSATFSGTGNVVEEPKAKAKSKTKAKKKKKAKPKKRKKRNKRKRNAKKAVRSGVARTSGKGVS